MDVCREPPVNVRNSLSLPVLRRLTVVAGTALLLAVLLLLLLMLQYDLMQLVVLPLQSLRARLRWCGLRYWGYT